MPKMRVLGALLCISIHLGSMEEKTGTWKHCSGSSHLPWRVCGCHCSLSGKMLLAAAERKPDQTGFPQKEIYHHHRTQAEVSDKRGSGQPLRALIPLICAGRSFLWVLASPSGLLKIVTAILCLSSRLSTLQGKKRGPSACLCCSLSKSLGDFLAFHWSAFAHMQITKSITGSVEWGFHNWFRECTWLCGREEIPEKKSASFREEWVLGGEYNHWIGNQENLVCTL